MVSLSNDICKNNSLCINKIYSTNVKNICGICIHEDYVAKIKIPILYQQLEVLIEIFKGLIFFLITIVFFNPLCLFKTFASEHESIKIEKVTTSPYNIKNGWISLPKTDGTLTVNITAKNAKMIKFYLIPTGTATYNQRKLIGISRESNGDFIFKWHFRRDKFIFHHFAIEVINSKDQIAASGVLFNVTNE